MTWKTRGTIEPFFYEWKSYLPLEYSSETYRFTFENVDQNKITSFCYFRRKWYPQNQPPMVERAQRIYVKGDSLVVHIPIIPLFETIWNVTPSIEICKIHLTRRSQFKIDSNYRVKLEYYI